MVKLKVIKLEDEITLTYGKSLTKNKRIEGPFNVYGSNGVVGKHKEAIFKGPGVIIGRKGTVGSVVLSREDFYAIDTTYVLKLNNQNDDLIFWYYYLRTLGLEQMNSHSAVPGLSRDAVYKKEVKILNDINVRKKVAATLSCLDDKIELNNQMNKKLEEIAQAIFKSWFVDFEPFQDGEFEDSELGRIPKGWRVGFLGDKCLSKLVKPGIKNFRGEKIYIATADVENSNIINNTNKITLNNRPSRANMQPGTNTVWFAKMKDSRKLIFVDEFSKPILENYIFSTGFAGIECLNNSLYYIWCILLSKNFNSIKNNLCNGTTMQAINNDNIKKISVIIPDSINLKNFKEIMKPIFFKWYENFTQSQKLSQIRDTLLPKLMSGEIRVPIEEVQNGEE